MLELEVKAFFSDEASENFLSLNLPVIDELIQIDTYYQHPCVDFVATDEALRIRLSGSEAKITYKGPKLDKDTKMRAEHETTVDNPAEARMILERLGFHEVGTVEKRRQRFQQGDLCIAIDEVRNLGSFIEIEALTEDQIESAKERIFSFLRGIGIARECTIRDSYLELLLKKASAHPSF